MGRTIAPGERPLYKGAKITFVTEQTGQKTLYKPRVENYSALLAQYSAAADDLFRRNTAMTELIAQDIRANWGRTTSAKIAEDKIGRDDAYAKSAVFYFSKHGYQPLTKDMRAPIALFVYQTWGGNEIFLKDYDAPVVRKIAKTANLKAW